MGFGLAAADADGAALADASAVGADAVALGSGAVAAGAVDPMAAGAAPAPAIFTPITTPRTSSSTTPAPRPMNIGNLLFGSTSPPPNGELSTPAVPPSGAEIPIGGMNTPPSAIDGGRADSAFAARAFRSMRPESSLDREGGGSLGARSSAFFVSTANEKGTELSLRGPVMPLASS